MVKKHILTFAVICMMMMVFAPQQAEASDGFFSKIKGMFSKDKGIPEYQCQVSFANTHPGQLITVSDSCQPYFIKHGSLGQTCQLYSYSEKKGISQCNFCVDRYLSKTDKKLPKECLEVKIERTHFSMDEMEMIAKDYQEKNDDNTAERDVEVGRIAFVNGKGFIQRSSRVFPAIIGEGLMCGDVVSTETGSDVTIQIEGKSAVKLSGNERYSMPECRVKTDDRNAVSKFFGNMWSGIKSKLAGEDEKKLTATAGVRG